MTISNEFIELTSYKNDTGLDYFKNRIKKIAVLMEYFIPKNYSAFQKFFIICDFVYCIFRYGSGINDYFQYNFYRRKANDRKTFIVWKKWIHIIKKCNGTIENKTFDDKSLFNQNYSEFLGRDWLDVDKSSYDDYLNFVSTHDNILYKARIGSGGKGIGTLESDDYKSSETFNVLKSNQCILEEKIIQHPELAEFNPFSVNTLRVVTIRNKDTVNVMSAVLRIGNGKGITDNFHFGGLAANIDVDSGVVYSVAIDKMNRKFLFHPYSKKQIIGYKIPMWNKILDVVKEAALINSEVRYVGWDIAISQDSKICIIEGNCASDPDIVQMPDQIGKWPEYKRVLDKLD